MATLLAGEMLADISAASPCGDDLEYDPDFLALEQVVNGKPEVQFGETMVAATPPDWKVAEALSLDLLAKGRDLRVAVHPPLTSAWAWSRGNSPTREHPL